jgi:hypothetical protein
MGKTNFLKLFFEFLGGFSFEDLQKNTSKMWENSVVFEKVYWKNLKLNFIKSEEKGQGKF